MKTLVTNTAYGDSREGGFSLSHIALMRLRDLGQKEASEEMSVVLHSPEGVDPRDPAFNTCGHLIPRDDAKLVRVIEELGDAANGHSADLKIVLVPDDSDWIIENMNGVEHAARSTAPGVDPSCRSTVCPLPAWALTSGVRRG
jgi:hypothetical protein